jgi:hypothetical protein
MTVIETIKSLLEFKDDTSVYVVDGNKIKSIDNIQISFDMDTNKPSCMIHIKR